VLEKSEKGAGKGERKTKERRKREGESERERERKRGGEMPRVERRTLFTQCLVDEALVLPSECARGERVCDRASEGTGLISA
jgi:hypothetical protein